MKLPRLRRLSRRFVPRPGHAGGKDLWWVRLILNVGRPVVAVFVLVMCAPGEHYLARQAGWSEQLAWGMPATLTAYAGIAAVVATKRAPGTPGKGTAVAGAVTAILLAMGAQPIAHLYGRTGMLGQQVVLTAVVSCIPALVFGHLLHMAVSRDKDTDAPVVLGCPVPADGQDNPGRSPATRPAAVPPVRDKDITVHVPPVPSRTSDTVVQMDTSRAASVSGHVLSLLTEDKDMSREEVRTSVRDIFGQDTKDAGIDKAITRAKDKIRRQDITQDTGTE